MNVCNFVPSMLPLQLCFLLLWGGCQSVVFVDDISENDVPQCAPAGTSPLICENFESQIPSSTQMRSGDIRLDESIVFNGESSLRCETETIQSYAFFSSRFTPIQQGTIYFRVHMFIAPDTITGTTKVLNLTSAFSTDIEAVQSIDINISAAYRFEIYQHGNQTRYQSESNLVPENRWFCLHGSYTTTKTAGEMTIWIDDFLAVSTPASTYANIIGGVSEFRTGIGWTEQGQYAAVYYFDDILVDTVPVSCENPSLN